jgi:hypothetical protein
MTATWVSSAFADKKDQQLNITTFPPQAVEISFTSPGTYQEIAEDIQIHEVKSDDTLGKKVGKLRLLFLDVITLKAILIKVTDTDPANFIYERILQTADIPWALESDDDGTTIPHANVLQDTNTYGLKQIGINLELEKNTVEPYVSGSTKDVPMFRDPATNLPTPFKLAKGTGSTVEEQYDAARTAFMKKILYLQDGTSPKLSKFSRMYIFFTSLDLPGKRGQSRSPSTAVNFGSKQSLSRDIDIIPNVSLFRWTKSVPPAESEAVTRTLTHEGAHALLVEHYFDEEKELEVFATDTEPAKTYKYLKNFLNANVIFSLCLQPSPVRPHVMVTGYDKNKIKIENFRNAATGKLLFEDIVISGFDDAVDSFIDQVIFPASSPRPVSWKDPDRNNAVSTFILSDLYVWIALNDMVKFILYQTDNIMDYLDPTISVIPNVNTSNNKSYLGRHITHFNRFQWQLARRTASRLNDLIYQP